MVNEYLIYLSGGLLGDFIFQLSVINENYIETGKKGILYISNKGETFRNGLENTYKETYNLIKNLDYIKDYLIYNNEDIDIDLTIWRKNKDVEYENWFIKYSNTYKINWGKNKWLTCSTNNKWKEKKLINTTSYRWPCNIDFNKIFDLYSNDLIFISFDINQYNFFKEKTGLEIENYILSNIDELCIIINSCQLIIGSQSSPLAIAFALKKEVIICECLEDYSHEHGHHYIEGLSEIFENVKFNI